MEKILVFGWLLIHLTGTSEPDIRVEEQQMIVEVEEKFEGYLFKDEMLVVEINENLQNEKFDLATFDPGIYSLYDKEGSLVDQEIIVDDKIHIAFDQMPRCIKENKYLFQKQPTTKIISPQEDPLYDSIGEEEYYTYVFKENEIHFLNEIYELYIDECPPQIELNDLTKLEENIYITHQNQIKICYQDECPDAFKRYETNEFVVDLFPGINDLETYLYDEAGHKAAKKLWVIYDPDKPTMVIDSKLYLNQPQIIPIEEMYLDDEHSFVTIDQNPPIPLKTNVLEINQGGNYEVVLRDLAGNENQYHFQVVYDTTCPSMYVDYENGTFSISFSEPLKQHLLSWVSDEQTASINQLIFEVTHEGNYLISGFIEDLSGNKAYVNYQQWVDLYPPEVNIDLKETFYLKSPSIQIEGDDLRLTEWQIELYRNDQLIQQHVGQGCFNEVIQFNESEFEDGRGDYELIVYARDGIHTTKKAQCFVVDEKCADIQLMINNLLGKNVEELYVKEKIVLEASCLEGDVFYELYKDSTLINKGNKGIIELMPEDYFNKIVFRSFDEAGHESEKTILLTYPQKVILPTTFIQETKQEEKEVIVQKEPEEEIEKKHEVEKQTINTLPFYIGGMIVAFISLRWIYIRSIRPTKDNKNIPSDTTLLLQDLPETECLSDQENSSSC